MKNKLWLLSIITAVLLFTGCSSPEVPPIQVSTGPTSEILYELFDEPLSEPENISVTVYVTDTGKKYHDVDCGYLWKSCHAISLEEAIDSYYKPCSVCSPQY